MFTTTLLFLFANNDHSLFAPNSLTRTVTGASGANYAFLKLMELENGKLYTFSATPSIAASMQVYDFDNESTGGDFGRHDFAANTRGSHTFVVPDDGHTWTLR